MLPPLVTMLLLLLLWLLALMITLLLVRPTTGAGGAEVTMATEAVDKEGSWPKPGIRSWVAGLIPRR